MWLWVDSRFENAYCDTTLLELMAWQVLERVTKMDDKWFTDSWHNIVKSIHCIKFLATTCILAIVFQYNKPNTDRSTVQ